MLFVCTVGPVLLWSPVVGGADTHTQTIFCGAGNISPTYFRTWPHPSLGILTPRPVVKRKPACGEIRPTVACYLLGVTALSGKYKEHLDIHILIDQTDLISEPQRGIRYVFFPGVRWQPAPLPPPPQQYIRRIVNQVTKRVKRQAFLYRANNLNLYFVSSHLLIGNRDVTNWNE